MDQIDTIKISNFHLKDNGQGLNWHEIEKLETKLKYGLNDRSQIRSLP